MPVVKSGFPKCFQVISSIWWNTKMSSNGEFSTISSGEIPSLPTSLSSSRDATAEGNSSSGGSFVSLRDFLDRFSLPRVVRLEGTTGRPVLLYKQQQRSLRVTATLLMHRYRHDVKVGPEIVIPEGYPGECNILFNIPGESIGKKLNLSDSKIGFRTIRIHSESIRKALWVPFDVKWFKINYLIRINQNESVVGIIRIKNSVSINPSSDWFWYIRI